jgi:hypothetical protein
MMPISVRLDKKTEAMLEEAAKAFGASKASIIKESLTEYCPKMLAQKRKRPYELIRDIAGKTGSKKGDLASRGEEILRDAFRRKR